MFTGIIRHRGTVTGVRPHAGGSRLSIGCRELARSVLHGASICVNGVCLTVADARDPILEFDVIAETLRRSTLGLLRVGGHVNLEPSLRAGGPIDGHIVQGHIDGTAKLTRRDISGAEHVLHFDADRHLYPYLMPKGSIAIDGVSLTIVDVRDGCFSVALIPTTLELTTLADLRVGHRVNVESDMIVRTIVHTIESMRASGGLTLTTLQSYGFA